MFFWGRGAQGWFQDAPARKRRITVLLLFRTFGRKWQPDGLFWEPFWIPNRSKNDANIDTKIDAENDAKMINKT